MQKNNNNLLIYCDGGSRGNPGPAASAFVVTLNNQVIYKESKYLGIETNNFAEYIAVIMALTWINASIQDKNTIINLDSQLIERQINGLYKVKNEKLKILNNQVNSLLLKLIIRPQFIWNYRSKNKLADSLVNEELDSQKK